jgi:nicotinate phosphoribosyltransferase
VHLKGVRLDSGDLLQLARITRSMLDDAGMPDATIVASGDLDDGQIEALVAGGAPIDVWGVGTDLGTSRYSPTGGGVYKLVADRAGGPSPSAHPRRRRSRPPSRSSATRTTASWDHDVLALADEHLAGRPLLASAMREGRSVLGEPLDQLRARASAGLGSLPEPLRGSGDGPAYPVVLSERLAELTATVQEIEDSRRIAELGRPLLQHGVT